MYRAEVKRIHFTEIGDLRGKLVSIEGGRSIPFDIARVYYIYDTELNKDRGFHAHKKLKQILVAIYGKIKIRYEYKGKSNEIILDSPSVGLFIHGLVWHVMHFMEEGSVLMVLADDHYDESDYIRDYDTFKCQEHQNIQIGQ